MKAFDIWNLQAPAELAVVLAMVFLCSLLGTQLM